MSEEVKLTDGQRGLMNDITAVAYAKLFSGDASEMFDELKRLGLVEWRWNGGVAVYTLTPAGRAALAASPDTERTR